MSLTIAARIKEGKEEASLAWWREKGRALFEALPWVRAVGEATVLLDDPAGITLQVRFVADTCATADRRQGIRPHIVARPELNTLS